MPAFRYTFKERRPSLPSVIKAWFGKKYFIWKGKSLHQFVENMAKEIDRTLRLGAKENDLFATVVHHIKYARIALMEIEVVCQSEDPAEILWCERDLLLSAIGDDLCLNTQFVPYIPKWIPAQAVLAFERKVLKASQRPRNSGKKAVKGSGAMKKSSAKGQASGAPVKRSGTVAVKSVPSKGGKKTKATKTK